MNVSMRRHKNDLGFYAIQLLLNSVNQISEELLMGEVDFSLFRLLKIDVSR